MEHSRLLHLDDNQASLGLIRTVTVTLRDIIQLLESSRMVVNLHTDVALRVLQVFGVLDVSFLQAYDLNPGFFIYELGTSIRGVVRNDSHRVITIHNNHMPGRGRSPRYRHNDSGGRGST